MGGGRDGGGIRAITSVVIRSLYAEHFLVVATKENGPMSGTHCLVSTIT